MAQEKEVNKDFIANLVKTTGFNESLLTKDYYITKILYSLKNVKGMHFKGGTALNKTILEHARLSEDIDFTLTANINEKEKEIKEILKKLAFVKKVSHDKKTEGFIRIVVYYDDFHSQEEQIFVDLNSKATLLSKPAEKEIKHFYPGTPKFSMLCLSTEEMIAEKMAAAIQRNKPRDHYDLYRIIKNKNHINTDMVKKKCEQAGTEFSIIKMFNKAKKLHKRWNEDLQPLLVEEISFQEVMKTISNYFKLKEEKEKLKDK